MISYEQPSYSNFAQRLVLTFLVSLWFLLLLVLVLVTFPLRCSVQLLAKLFRSDLGCMLTGMNAVTALDRLDRPKTNIVEVFIMDGSVSLERLSFLLRTRVVNKKDPNSGRLAYPELRQVPTSFLGYLFWKNENNFSVDEHCRTYDYSDLPVGSTVTEDDIQIVLGELVSKPWKAGKSPWEYLLVPNFKPDTPTNSGASTALILRIHHVMGDGVALSRFFADLTDIEKVAIASPRWKEMSLCTSLIQSLKGLRAPWDFAVSLLECKDEPNAWRSDIKLSKSYHASFTKPILEDKVKEIKGRLGVAFAAVVYTAVVRGIAKFLESEGHKVPANLSMVTPVPLPSRLEGLTNHFSVMLIRLPLTIPSLLDHVRTVNGILGRFRGSQAGGAVNYLTRLGGLMPIRLMRAVTGIKGGHTFNISIFPSINGAGKDKLTIENSTFVDMIPALGLGRGQEGVVILVTGMSGLFRVTALIDKNVAKSQESFQNFRFFVEQELKALNELQPEKCTAINM